MESRLLDILVCPLCKSPLRHDKRQKELICRADRLAFPIRDGVPVMLESEARELGPAEPAADTRQGSGATAEKAPTGATPGADTGTGAPASPDDGAGTPQ